MTQDQYFQLLADLNLALWPWQVPIQIVGLAAIAVALRCPRGAPKAGPQILALASLGVAVFWYGFQLSRLDALAWIGLALHGILAGLLLAAAGKGDLTFGWRSDAPHWAGAFVLASALVGYPIIAFQVSHSYPFAAVFGLAPAPTNLYLWGFLLLSVAPPPRTVIAALLAATLFHGIWALRLDLVEDLTTLCIGMPAAVWTFRSATRSIPH